MVELGPRQSALRVGWIFGQMDMRDVLVVASCTILVILSLLHVYWAVGGKHGTAAAVPGVDGVAAFKPSQAATIAVAAALLSAAFLVAIVGNLLSVPLPILVTNACALALSTAFVARAIGDFRLIGFFKTRGDGQFAQLDTLVYSPLCLAVGVSVFLIVWTR